MSDSLIQLCDDLFSMVQRMKHPRCSIDFTPGEFHQQTGMLIYLLENHHILEKSTYPCFRYEPLNSIILSIPRHTGGLKNGKEVDFYAHQEYIFNKKDGNGKQTTFDKHLQANYNNKWSWKEANKHRKYEPLKEELAEIYVRLRQEFKEIKQNAWMDDPQDDPRKYPGTKRIT